MKKIWHPWHLWECYKYGFYSSCSDMGITKEEGQERYKDFFGDLQKFEKALIMIVGDWKYSCEHFLTDIGRNRIAWLGQASMVYATGTPAESRGGFKLLNEKQQQKADALALRYLKKWEHEQVNNRIYKQMEIPWISK